MVERGIDLKEFYTSVEWDVLAVPAVRYGHCILFSFHPMLEIMKYER